MQPLVVLANANAGPVAVADGDLLISAVGAFFSAEVGEGVGEGGSGAEQNTSSRNVISKGISTLLNALIMSTDSLSKVSRGATLHAFVHQQVLIPCCTI